MFCCESTISPAENAPEFQLDSSSKLVMAAVDVFDCDVRHRGDGIVRAVQFAAKTSREFAGGFDGVCRCHGDVKKDIDHVICDALRSLRAMARRR